MLDDGIKRKILERGEAAEAEGNLLSQQKLDQCYALFRGRFGPDRLSSLDGEALLTLMHDNSNHDSLAYWLEFKNDEEFPARFGSIAGGSALKFGVYRRAESGEWATYGEGSKPKDIPVEQAVEIARKHREQLMRGVDAIQRLPEYGSDAEYRSLQSELDAVAPDVSKLAWGHKYFSLLFPNKLDDFHSEEYQRFHLLKLFEPPPEGCGRYLCAGRFVRIAAELGLPLNSLTTILNYLHPKHRYWRISTGDRQAARDWRDLMFDGDWVAIGWSAVDDLSTVERSKQGREQLQVRLEGAYPGHPAVDKAKSQIPHFVITITEGDLVLAADGAKVIGIGRVTGDYSYDPTSKYRHRRPCTWLSLDEWTMPEPEGLQATVHEVRKHANILQVEQRCQRSTRTTVSPPTVPSKAGTTPTLDGVPGRIQSILDRKGQVVLYGPPGTGKTYWAERTACELAAYSSFGQPFEKLSAEQRQNITGTSAADGVVRLCCFHPAYGYEDFIEGYRPETINGHVTFALQNGVFKQIAEDAASHPDRRFYLIIDEINRGDIPRIFGELLTVIEKDKRGKGIVLPISRNVLRVPSNVYLIGTMNTADRSISLLDTALRRRFGFVELMPDSSVLRDHAVSGIPLGPWLDSLNGRICEHVGRDARNLQIGHSYLLQSGRPVKDFAALKRAIRDDIVPLLEEYCYEDFSALQSILGTALVDSEHQCIRHELFDEGHEEDLIQALVQPCPEISTSSAAISLEKEIAEAADDEEGDGVDQQ